MVARVGARRDFVGLFECSMRYPLMSVLRANDRTPGQNRWCPRPDIDAQISMTPHWRVTCTYPVIMQAQLTVVALGEPILYLHLFLAGWDRCLVTPPGGAKPLNPGELALSVAAICGVSRDCLICKVDCQQCLLRLTMKRSVLPSNIPMDSSPLEVLRGAQELTPTLTPTWATPGELS